MLNVPWTFPVVVGALLALALVAYLRRGGRSREWNVYRIALWIAALVYVGFAMVAGGTTWWIGIEIVGVAVFGALAQVGAARMTVLLGAGWVAHIAWDMGLHRQVDFVPYWYPLLCVGFDGVIGARILFAPAEGAGGNG